MVQRAGKYTRRTEYPVLSFELENHRKNHLIAEDRHTSLVARYSEPSLKTQKLKTQDSKPKTSYTSEESGNNL